MNIAEERRTQMENRLKTIDAETLQAMPMGKTKFIVDGLIPQGVNVLSGASKTGKSWLMLWLGLQVALGRPVWGMSTMRSVMCFISVWRIPCAASKTGSIS